MQRIITLKSLVTSKPKSDEKGKPTSEKVKFANRDVTHTVHEHTQHKAGALIEVEDALATELISAGHARKYVDGVDGTQPATSDALALN